MAKCVYYYKGKAYSPQRFASLTQQGLIDSIDYVNLGKKISVEEAHEYIRSVFGELPEGTFQFLSMHLLQKLSRPGETLLGLMDEGIMSFLKRTDGTTTEQIVRHETFHRIFNYYITEPQRVDLARAAQQMNPELVGKDIITIEEYLAEQFSDYVKGKPQTVKGVIAEFFKNLLEFFHIYVGSRDKIHSMFKAIDSGFFKDRQVEMNIGKLRRSLKVNVRQYGVADYMESIRILQSMFERYMFETSQPFTEKEAQEAVIRHLEKLADSQPIVKKMLEKDHEMNYVHLYNLIEDAFNRTADNEIYEDEDETTGESFVKDHIKLSDQINHEQKTSFSVKSFLNFIPVPNAELKRVPPRSAFILAARIMDGINMKQEKGKIQQDIIENTAELAEGALPELSFSGLEKWGTSRKSGNPYTVAVGKKLVKLVEDSMGDVPTRKARFIDENTFYYSLDPSVDVLSKGKTQLDILAKENKVRKVTRKSMAEKRENYSSANFTKDIATLASMDVEVVNKLFKQYQSQNRLSEITSLFGSMYRKNLYIAERINNYGVYSYKYYPASTSGIRLGIRSSVMDGFIKHYVKDGKVDPKFNIGKIEDKELALKKLHEYFKNLGLPEDLYKDISAKNAVSIVKKLDLLYDKASTAFKKKEKVKLGDLVSLPGNSVHETDKHDNSEEPETVENNEGEDPADPTVRDITIQDILQRDFTSLLSLISSSIVAAKPLQTSESVKAADGKKMYLLSHSSNAHDVLTAIRDWNTSSRKNRRTFEHMHTPFYAKYNRFLRIRSEKIIEDIIDHDGIKLWEDKAKDYTSESPHDWLTRNLSVALVDWVNDKTLENSEEKKKYVQFIPTMDRSRIIGVDTRLMRPDEIRTELRNMLEQMAERPDIKGLADYSRSSVVNFGILKQLAQSGLNQANAAKEFIANPSKENLSEDLVDGLLQIMDMNAEKLVGDFLNRKFVFSQNLNKVKKILFEKGYITTADLASQEEAKEYEITEKFMGKKTGKNGEYLTTAEDIRGIIKMFYRNNYVNAYWLTQAVAGDAAFFKNGAAYLKRLDKIFGPGERGLVNSLRGTPERSRIMVADSIEEKVLSDLFEGKPVFGLEFDPNDGQGFMLPERRDEIAAMHGESAKVGNILKPLHYEIVPKKLADGTTVMIPVMLKYSSVVLDDKVVAEFPKLAKLRDNMRRNGTMEMVFNTVVKVGTPNGSTLISSEELTTKDLTFSQEQLDSVAFYDIANENYRLQLNPVHKIDSKTAAPSQLTYFLNALTNEQNFPLANKVYQKMANIIQSTGEEFFKKYSTVSELRQALIDMGFSKNDERSAELIRSGISLNFPVLNNPVIMAFVSAINKSTTKIKFPGSKLVLQADFGVMNKETGQRLQYRTETINGKKHHYAEVVLPEEYQNLVSVGDYVGADAFGFRIPSSELHSAVPMKIVGFYKAPNANTIIAPRELVALHGSDFDVDSLFILRRSNYSGARELGIATEIMGWDYSEPVAERYPIGYIRNKDGKYVLDEDFEVKVDKFILDLDRSNPEYANQIEEAAENIRRKYWMNQIVEGMIEITTSERNAERMFAPINMGLYNGRAKREEEALKFFEDPIFRVSDHVHEMFSKDEQIEPYLKVMGLSRDSSVEKIEVAKKVMDYYMRRNVSEAVGSPLEIEGFRKWYKYKFAEGTIFRMLEELGIDVDSDYDLPDLGENLKAHRAIFEGNSLVGKFANAMKALSYSLRSSSSAYEDTNKDLKELYGELTKLRKEHENLLMEQRRKKQVFDDDADLNDYIDKIAYQIVRLELRIINIAGSLSSSEKIQKNLEEGKPVDPVKTRDSIIFDGRIHDELTEHEKKFSDGQTGKTTWEYFDALLNAAIDNLKEQILSSINASSNTVKAWVALTGMGVNMKTIVLFMRQPVIMALNDYDSTEKGVTDLKTALEKKMISSGYTIEDLENLSEDLNIKHWMMYEGIKTWQKNNIFNVNNLSEEELELQYKMLLQFEKADRIGNGISTLSSAISNTLAMKTKPEEFEKTQGDWAKIGEVIYDKKNKDSRAFIQTNSSFPFDLTFMMENLPHLKAAYMIMEKTKQKKSEFFFKYHKNVQDFLKKLDVRVSLDWNSDKAKAKMDDEFMKFVASASAVIPDVPPVKIDSKETLYGDNAFKEHFSRKIAALKSYVGNGNNKFLQSLTVEKANFDGKSYIRFMGTPNMEYLDMLDMEMEFRKLNMFDFTYEKGQWVVSKREFAQSEFSDFQREFLTYSLLTNGLGFAKSNYNTVLPMELLKEASDNMEKFFEKYTSVEELARIKQLFEVSLATNHYKSLPKMKSLQKSKLDKDTGEYVPDPGKGIEYALHMTDGKHVSGTAFGNFYDLAFVASFHKDQRKSLRQTDAPKYIRHFKKDTPFVHIGTKEIAFGDNVKIYHMYKRLGKNHYFHSQYRITDDVLSNGYLISNNLPSTMPVFSVNDPFSNEITVPETGFPVAEGMTAMVYGKSDTLKLNPRRVKITKAVLVENKIKNADGSESVSSREVKMNVEALHDERLGRKNISRQEASKKILDNTSVEIKEDLNGYSLTKAIEKFSPHLRKDQADLLKILSKYVSDSILIYQKNLSGALGVYQRDGNTGELTITIATGTHQDIGHTLIHEVVHAATAHLFESFSYNTNSLSPKQVEALSNLMDIYQVAKVELSLNKKYGFKDPSEFIAEALSNQEFQKELDTIVVDNESLWDKLLRFLGDLLLVKEIFKIVGIPLESRTALSYTLKNSVVLMEEEYQNYGKVEKERSFPYWDNIVNAKPLSVQGIVNKVDQVDQKELEERIKNCL